MKQRELSHVVISEHMAEPSISEQVDTSRAHAVVRLTQWRNETPHQFALRVRSAIARLGIVAGATLLCSQAADRAAIASRRVMLDACLAAMRGVSRRKLILACALTRNGKAPQWAAITAQGIEEDDPALDLIIDFTSASEAA